VGRIRTIKPEFPHSETIGNLSRDARLLFIQLWTLVDDAGRTRAASRMLASLLYPYDDDAPSLMPDWLAELECQACIHLYKVEGNQYLEICNWLKHQKIDHPTASRLPAYSESLASPREDSRMFAPDLVPRTMDLVPSTKAQEAEERFSLPDWIPEKTWCDYLAMRKKIRKPATDEAIKLAVETLKRLRASGDDPRLVLEQSILNSWQGLFELKGKAAIKSDPSRPTDAHMSGGLLGMTLAQYRDIVARRTAEGLPVDPDLHRTIRELEASA
jgi:hypothetical protein